MPIAPTYPNATYRDGDYLYELQPNGSVRLLESPRGSEGKYVTPANPHYAAIMGKIEDLKAAYGAAAAAQKGTLDEAEMNQARRRAMESTDTGRSPGAAEMRAQGLPRSGSPGLLDDDTAAISGRPMPAWAKALLEHAPLPPQARSALAADPEAWLEAAGAAALGVAGDAARTPTRGLGDLEDQWMTGKVPGQPMGAGRNGQFTEGAYSRAGNRFPEDLTYGERYAQSRQMGRPVK